MTPTEFARLKNYGVRLSGDARLGSQVMLLGLMGELTNRQGAAALRVGEIYNRFRRLKRLRASVKSPNYEGGFSGGADVAEERMTPEQISALEEAIAKAHDETKL